ncbi:MAG TPA: hypothetical protein VGS22_26725 [Thermoanaerobaculia bacterium]|jgi:hypothetical protein|nr:hypothetical protein [Thermoanaerobaculia bacterium]
MAFEFPMLWKPAWEFEPQVALSFPGSLRDTSRRVAANLRRLIARETFGDAEALNGEGIDERYVFDEAALLHQTWDQWLRRYRDALLVVPFLGVGFRDRFGTQEEWLEILRTESKYPQQVLPIAVEDVQTLGLNRGAYPFPFNGRELINNIPSDDAINEVANHIFVHWRGLCRVWQDVNDVCLLGFERCKRLARVAEQCKSVNLTLSSQILPRRATGVPEQSARDKILRAPPSTELLIYCLPENLGRDEHVSRTLISSLRASIRFSLDERVWVISEKERISSLRGQNSGRLVLMLTEDEATARLRSGGYASGHRVNVVCGSQTLFSRQNFEDTQGKRLNIRIWSIGEESDQQFGESRMYGLRHDAIANRCKALNKFTNILLLSEEVAMSMDTYPDIRPWFEKIGTEAEKTPAGADPQWRILMPEKLSRWARRRLAAVSCLAETFGSPTPEIELRRILSEVISSVGA